MDDGASDALLFVHYPSIWDIRKAPKIFFQMNRELLQQFKERRVSIYNLHVPLDNFGEYSTSNTLAKALGIVVEKSFAQYFGGLCGVIGKTNLETIGQLQERLVEIVGHEVKLYQYGNKQIRNGRVAIVADGGNDMDVADEIIKEDVQVLVSGVTVENDFSKKVHDFERKNKINLLGGTHYSTEKFACIAMCEYFKKLGLLAEFISNEPVLEDM